MSSPYHTKRVQERDELQTLNTRLESYVLHTKDIADERDRLAAELAGLREEFASEKKEIYRRHEVTVTTLREEVSELQSQLADREVQIEEYEREVPQLRARLKELEDVRRERDALAAEVDPLKAEITDLKAEIRRLSKLLKTTQKEVSTKERTINTLNSRVESQRETVTTLERQLSDVDGRHASELQSLKESTAANLLAARQEWERSNAQKIAKLERDLKEKYDKEMEELRSHATELQEQVNRLTKANSDLKDDVRSKSVNIKELIAQITRMEEESEATDWSEKYRALEKEIASLHSRLFSKEDEFNDLMDIKISLEAEIEHYRRILDVEEERSGLSPAPSRAVSPVPDEDPAPAPTKTPKGKGRRGRSSARKTRSTRTKSTKVRARTEIEEHVVDAGTKKRQRTLTRTVTKSVQSDLSAGVDLELDLIADTVKITNNTGDDLDLAGWVLCSEVGTQNFSFPDDLVLGVGESTTVWSGKGADKHHKPPQHLFWTKRYIWNNEGDSAVLKDPSGKIIQSVTGEPLSLDDVDKELADGKQENCTIM